MKLKLKDITPKKRSKKKPINKVLKVTKGNKHYILKHWPPGAIHGTNFALINEDDEAMGISEEVLFDILDSYFQREL